MSEYSQHPLRPISEIEVFIGNILGKTGAQSKRQRDLSTSMKERFERDVAFTINCIVKDGGNFAVDSATRSVACLEVAFEEGRTTKSGRMLESFKYIAASVCLKEIERI
jgi:hypothetical protein